jgi:hypothetical protein
MSNLHLTFNLRGTIHLIRDTESVNSGFHKREVIIEVTGQHPQFIRMEAHNRTCTALDNFQTQDNVDVTWTLKGKPFQGKYFTNLIIRDIQRVGERQPLDDIPEIPNTPPAPTPTPTSTPTPDPTPASTPAPTIVHPDEDHDDNVLF